MGRTTTAQYRQSMHAQVRKVTNPSITLTYTGASNYYFNNTKITSLKRTQTVDILGRSLPTETLTWVARMPSDYNIKNPSGTYGAVKTGSTAIINFLQVLQDGTTTHGCGTASNYMDTFYITSITENNKTKLFTFVAKSKLTILNSVYKSESYRFNAQYFLGEVAYNTGLTFEHDIPATDGGIFIIPSAGQERKTILQQLAGATGRAIYTYDNKVQIRQWDLTAAPTTYLSKRDYYQDGLDTSENDTIKSLTIQENTREEQAFDPSWTSATKPTAIKYRMIGTMQGGATQTFVVTYDEGKEYDVSHSSSSIQILVDDVSVTSIGDVEFGLYNITLPLYNANYAATDIYVRIFGAQPTYVKTDRIWNNPGVTQGQDIRISGNSFIDETLAADLETRYREVYSHKTTMKVKYRGLQEVYCGDIIAIEDETGAWQKVVVTSAILDYDGALSGELTGLVLGTTSSPVLRKTANRAINDVDERPLIPADLQEYTTSYTPTQIDDFIDLMLGAWSDPVQTGDNLSILQAYTINRDGFALAIE